MCFKCLKKKKIKGVLETISREENTTQNGQADLKKNKAEFLEMKNTTIEMKRISETEALKKSLRL